MVCKPQEDRLGIDGIIERIKKDALAEAERIRQEYSSEIDKLESAFEQERAKAFEEAQILAANERETSCKRSIDKARSMISQRILTLKRELLDKLYRELREYVECLPKKSYCEIFINALRKLGETEGTIIVAADKDILDDDFIRLASERIENDFGKKCNFAIRKVDGSWRGFILEKEKIRYNVTLDAILSTAREKTEEKIIQRLFSM